MTPSRPARPDRQAPLAVSMGDPAGIGAELLAAAFARGALPPPFLVIGDAGWLSAAGAPVERIASPVEAGAVEGAVPVLHRPLRARAEPGRPDPANAPAVVAAIEEGVALCLSGEAAGLVTLPINKKALYDGAGFAFPGHTEYLAHLGGVRRTVMLLAGPGMMVAPATIHVPLAEVPAALTAELLEETIRILAAALVRDFAIAAPRIAVSGLNPHAGEGGAMGREEVEIIAPLLDRLREEGMTLLGPLPADTMFHERARAGYDAAVCMYHDQALIPIKTIAFDLGVNVTLGLPFVRTSPDHGTAYDIAGKGVARPDSFIEAFRLARAIAAARAA